jgi:hypothetical protein
VVLRCGDRVIDEVVYLDSTDGASRAYDGDLPPNATANDDTTRWCDSTCHVLHRRLRLSRRAQRFVRR